ncbi:hypothetical protein PspLS_04620 [Pyricularia sp. CBS 133598]|nr:hypothetical protein PspLS_04620 [Pyricularia sp. CBS 133598]
MPQSSDASTGAHPPQPSVSPPVQARPREAEYPINLPRTSMSRYCLRNYQNRLDICGEALFAQGNTDCDNPPPGKKEFHPWVILQSNENESPAYTNDECNTLKKLVSRLYTSGKQDPRCRLVFISAERSNGPLDGSLKMIKHLLSYQHVSPKFLDTLFLFCKQPFPPTHASFVHSAAFYQDNLFHNLSHHGRYAIPHLGRSGRQLRLCYNLWGVESDGPDSQGREKWLFRQTAMYHSLDMETAKTFWINVKANWKMLERMRQVAEDEETFPESSPRDRQIFQALLNSLDLHMVAAEWCIEGWAGFTRSVQAELSSVMVELTNIPVEDLGEAIKIDVPELLIDILKPGSRRNGITQALKKASKKNSEPNTFTGRGGHGQTLHSPEEQSIPGFCEISLELLRQAQRRVDSLIFGSRKSEKLSVEDPFRLLEGFKFEQIQRSSKLGARLNQARLIMKMNSSVMLGLVGFYASLLETDEISTSLRSNISGGVHIFRQRIESCIKTLEIERSRAEMLLQTVATGKTLTPRGSVPFLQCESIMQFRNTGINQLFLIAAHQTAAEMRKIADDTERQTTSMHIITWVTLVFLPGTFVSTLFGSGLYQWDDNDPEMQLPRWKPEYFRLFAKICFPLMGVTIIGWFLALFWASKRRNGAPLKAEVLDPESKAEGMGDKASGNLGWQRARRRILGRWSGGRKTDGSREHVLP